MQHRFQFSILIARRYSGNPQDAAGKGDPALEFGFAFLVKRETVKVERHGVFTLWRGRRDSFNVVGVEGNDKMVARSK